MKKGIFIAVSVGPGKPEWLTVEAVRALEGANVIAAPATGNGREFAYEIASAAVDLSGKEKLSLRFSMTSDPGLREKEYGAAEKEISAHLERGEDVAMTVLGDISVYSTASDLLTRFRKKGFESRMIPGVTSFCAAASRIGTVLAEGRSQIHILPGMEISEEELSLSGTKVFMKTGKGLQDLLRKILDTGLGGDSILIQNCGLPGERIRTDLSEIGEDAEPEYFSLVIVKG